MARLFSLADAVAHDHPEYGHFEPDAAGGFAFPDDLSDALLRFHVRGRPLWEDEIQRQQRVAAETLAQQRDPAYLAGLVAQLVAAGPKQPATPEELESVVARAVEAALAAQATAALPEAATVPRPPRKAPAKAAADA